MKPMEKLIYDFTLQNFEETINECTDEQLLFAENMTKQLILNKDTNIVEAIPAPCGFGKSVLIRSYLKANILSRTIWGIGESVQSGKYEGVGFVVVTDLLERFEEYNEDEDIKDYCYMMYYNDDFNESFQKQLLEQNNYPILLMSTQKYFKLSKDEKDFIFKWKRGLRKTIIFDEKPIFYNITEIDKEFINTIDNEIDPISETEDKNFLDNELKFLRDYLEEEKGKLSNKSEEDVICYWKGTRKNISTNDTQFLKLTNDYLSSDSKIKVNTLKEILENGAIFVNKKNKQVTDNRRMFFTIEDNKEDFYLGEDKAKFWIFDATADIDVEYQKEYINMIDVECNKDFKIDIKNINVGTSRNALNQKGNKEMLVNYINNNFDSNTLVISYQKDIHNFNEFNTGYLGGIKGSNNYRNCTDMAQIGLNRYSDIDYLQKYLYLNSKTYDYLRNNVIESESILNGLLEMEYGNFVNEDMNNIMYSMLLVDTEQNIFRTKLRNYANKDNINIDLIYNSNTYKQLNEMLAERLGINEMKVTLPLEILEHNILSRDNEKESHAQKIVRWFNENKGYGEIKTRDMLKNVGISADQFKNAKKDSNTLKKYMDNKRVRRGIYTV